MPDPIEQTPVEATDIPENAVVDTAAPVGAPAAEPEAAKVDEVDATLAVMLSKEPEPAAAAETPAVVPPVADPAKPVAEPEKPAAPTPEEAKAKVDAEIADLGIKNERAAARFRDLSARAAEAEPLKAKVAELEPKVQQLEVFRQRAIEWEEAVTSTGASPEQFGALMNYATLMNSGNPQSMEAGFALLEDEYHAAAKLLGKAAGSVDPLQDHPDLQAKVANMDIDRDTALELIRLRTRDKLAGATTNIRTEQDQAARAQSDGIAAVSALGAELRASDPAFASKFAMIEPLVTEMQRTLPPAQWATAIRQMWAKIPAAQPAPVPVPTPKPTISPMRPGVSSAGQTRGITDPVDATLAVMMGGHQV